MSSGRPLRLVLASANPDKAAEIAAVLGDAIDVELLPRPPEVPDVVEDGETLLDNARLKAQALVAATGLPAVADDTGLEVDALGGAPGVYSARYAGEDVTYADNVAKLLTELDALPDAGGGRAARFRTVALVAFPDGTEVWAEGVVEGTIARAGAGKRRIRLRPGVRAGRRRRTHLRRDDAGGEARHLAPGPGVPVSGGRARRSRRRLSRTATFRQASSGAAFARAARIIWTPLVRESRISWSLSLEMKSCTRFSSRKRRIGLKA